MATDTGTYGLSSSEEAPGIAVVYLYGAVDLCTSVRPGDTTWMNRLRESVRAGMFSPCARPENSAADARRPASRVDADHLRCVYGLAMNMFEHPGQTEIWAFWLQIQLHIPEPRPVSGAAHQYQCAHHPRLVLSCARGTGAAEIRMAAERGSAPRLPVREPWPSGSRRGALQLRY